MSAPLSGLRVLDLSRILAGPTATQLLADLGAEVIKIERPGSGDDTRGWGPPFLQDADGRDTRESAYYLCANRGKKSVAVDIAAPEGQAIIRDLAGTADILIENFKVGGLAKYGLDHDSLKALNPRLIYCSITGFGQTGPLKHRAGYDFLIQGMGGIMSLTGSADGAPMKVGVGIADVMCGMYAVSAILAAVHARHTTGRGQYIDIALLDSQLAWLINQGAAYLMNGKVPPRRGNEHPTIVPYGTFPGADKPFILAVGNDGQFARFCAIAARPELAEDPRFARNVDRVRNRETLIPILNEITATRPAADWIAALDDQAVPCGPINDLAEALDQPQAQVRQMKITLPHPVSGSVDLIGNPIRMSETPVAYGNAPPTLGQHTAQVLTDLLGADPAQLRAWAAAGVIGTAEEDIA
ncbi:CoA transferase [Rhodobacteraceae bacterium 2CG4]|uniref:CoA transferase n=1 Tax=Halovulum marinum TaxID=2662447 RepID=A0A6L5YZ09_9RHOB|nr:CaiB/BaiF CoA-transferase family protein [Halovulum marinum]MSU89448.1 CoA transferase [Halovulum marinum]